MQTINQTIIFFIHLHTLADLEDFLLICFIDVDPWMAPGVSGAKPPRNKKTLEYTPQEQKMSGAQEHPAPCGSEIQDLLHAQHTNYIFALKLSAE